MYTAQLVAARARETNAKLALGSEIDGENTAVAQLVAQLDSAKWELDQTTVRVPSDRSFTLSGPRPFHLIHTALRAVECNASCGAWCSRRRGGSWSSWRRGGSWSSWRRGGPRSSRRRGSAAAVTALGIATTAASGAVMADGSIEVAGGPAASAVAGGFLEPRPGPPLEIPVFKFKCYQSSQ
jgi:hypothetical protein